MGGCAPAAASLLFFLLLVSDFHQDPELPVPPLSAMAGRRGARQVGKGPLSRWGRRSAAGKQATGWEPRRRPVRASEDPKTLSRPHLQENGGGALGTTWGGRAFFLEGVPAEMSAVQLSRLLLLVSPGASNFCSAQRWRQFWALSALGSGVRAPRRNRCQAHCPR